MEAISERIGDVFENLRKADGTKYKGDKNKAINGALYSTGIFRKVGDGWVIRPEECAAYEQRMKQKLQTRGKKSRVLKANSNFIFHF